MFSKKYHSYAAQNYETTKKDVRSLNDQAAKINSIVQIKILEKNNSNYLILVNSKVYYASLPVAVEIGELLLARIKNFNPLTLQLNDLVEHELHETEIELMLFKLNVKSTQTAKSRLNALLRKGEPVIKSNVTRFEDCYMPG